GRPRRVRGTAPVLRARSLRRNGDVRSGRRRGQQVGLLSLLVPAGLRRRRHGLRAVLDGDRPLRPAPPRARARSEAGGADPLEQGPRAIRVRRLSRPEGAAPRDRAARAVDPRRPGGVRQEQRPGESFAARAAHAAPVEAPRRSPRVLARRAQGRAMPRNRLQRARAGHDPARECARGVRDRGARPAPGARDLSRSARASPAEPHQQRGEASSGPDRPDRDRVRGARRPLRLLGRGRRRRHTAGICRAPLRDVPDAEAPRSGRGQRHGPRDREANRRVARRQGVVRAWSRRTRHGFQVRVAERRSAGRGSGDEDMSSKVVNILLVEDDEVDVRALRWAFEKLRIANPLTVASDGVEALEILKTFPRPYLIITDINMPRMNGIELLRHIRASEELRDSIVFVLTTSNDEQDKIDAYNLNVAGYMLKSDMGTSFTRAIGLIDNYWKVVEFPGTD